MKIWTSALMLLRLHFWSVFRFGLVGIVTAFIYFFVMWIASSRLNLNYIWAVSAAYCLSTLFHYLANRHFTFAANNGTYNGQIARYMVMWAINYAITIFVVRICVEHIGLSAYFGVCVAVAITVFVGYFLSRYWVFKVGDVVV